MIKKKILIQILASILFLTSLSFAVDISACTNLAASTSYTMTANVNSINGSCMNITGNSVTLNCNGNYINYTQGYGINNSKGYDYLRIENCTLIQNYTGAGSSSGYGIFLNGSIYNNITNNSITTNGNSSHGIYVYSSSQRNNITNNSITTSGVSAFGIYVYTSATYNNLTQNNIWAKGNSSYAMQIYTTSDYNQIINNTMTSNGSSSYTLHSRTTYNNITNNTINVSGSASNPVYLRSAQYNNIINNTIRSALSGIDGVLIYGTGTTKNNFSSNYFITTTGVPITFSSVTGTPTTCETDYNQTIDTTNTEQGAPILFIFNQSDYELSGTGNYSFVLAACSPRLNIHDNNFTSSGIDIWQSNDSIVRNNRITLTGSYKDGIAARYGQGHDIYRNNITVSTGAYGIYVSTANTTEIYENNISRTGSSGYGLYEYNGYYHTTHDNNIAMTGSGTSAYLVYYYMINVSYLYNNNISQGSSGSSSHGLYFRNSENNAVFNNNITSASTTGYGVYFYSSSYNTFYNNIIKATGTFAFQIHNATPFNSTGNEFYNNFFNGTNMSVNWTSTSNMSQYNEWNITNQSGTRIYSTGKRVGGNFYALKNGNGFSETCTDADLDGFCDAYFNVTANNSCTGADCELNNTDFLAYSNKYAIPPSITGTSLSNTTAWVNFSNVSFSVTATDDYGIDTIAINIQTPYNTTNYTGVCGGTTSCTLTLLCGPAYTCLINDTGQYNITDVWANNTLGVQSSLTGLTDNFTAYIDTNPPEIGNLSVTDIAITQNETTEIVVNITDNETEVSSAKIYIQAPYGYINATAVKMNSTHWAVICGKGLECATNDTGIYYVLQVWANDTMGNVESDTRTAAFAVEIHQEVFGILLSCLYISCILGSILITFVLRNKHPELSVFFVMISFFFMTSGFYVSTEIADTIDNAPESILGLINTTSFAVMIISIFIVLYFLLHFILTLLKNMQSKE